MNGINRETHKYKRRESAAADAAQSYPGPGDVEAQARENTLAVIITDLTAIDANTAVDRIIEDSCNGESWAQIGTTDTLTAVAVTRKEVVNFAGFLRVRYVVRATSGSSVVGSTFGGGLTYKQT